MKGEKNLAGKRKDKKGRILLKNESERSDGRYQYRYTDVFGKRQTFYAPTLDELRQKEKELQRALDQLYEKCVPAEMREYLDSKRKPVASRPRPRRSPRSGAAETQQHADIEVPDE